ncbi:C25 family cysteine peptidase [Lewinella sp. JB7]|uniref:putative type IX secretion system sortase PorU2 n=1 Tax=Lewinella sp. JB7 TaxID=2962887 RepID=UPI0020C96D95|nr:C25 family cysteine peptidase [Lewinella sp. JB7]MCP9234810.1 C25 family cysteine peptidase [Lewinella sp. JB7]
MLRTFTLLYTLLSSLVLVAQVDTEHGERFGNEWFAPGSSFLKVTVVEDGMYRIDAATLNAAGLSPGGDVGSRLVMYHHGEAIPVEVTSDAVSFYGRRSRGELDTYLFTDPAAQQLNPRYGMYTDTAAYYLGLAEAGVPVPRFTSGPGTAAGPNSTVIQRTTERVFGDQQSKFFRRSSGTSIYFSHYELAEGFGSRGSSDLLSSNGTTVTDIDLALPDATGAAGTLELRFGLAFGNEHLQQISVGGQLLGEVSGTEWSMHTASFSFTPSGQRAAVRIAGTADDQDKANLAYARVTYPATAVFSGNQLAFTLPAGDARTLTFAGSLAGARLYDLDNDRVYVPSGNAFLLPAAAAERRFRLVGTYMAPASSATLQLRELLPESSADYLVLTSRRLAGAGMDALTSYRSSAVGGGYRVHRVYVEDIYDAFGYGVSRHPQALRNYLSAAMERAPGLAYLFIVGKGREYDELRTEEQLARARETFFVPSFGLPASDNLLTAVPGDVTPRLATGRLAAITPEEISIYVTKLKAVERQVTVASQTTEDLDWMKQALFLGGGQSAGEQASIRYNLGTMENIFEKSTWGGNVTGVFRTSTDPIETTRQQIIFNRINAGVSILTFYGHSSSQGFDFNIDNPDNYKNKDKYPFMMSLGCYSGDAFTEARSISERFIFLPEGGAITFAASKGLGYISALGTYGRAVFNHLANDNYGMGIGDAIKSTVADYAGTSNFTMGILLEQFALSGDPAFRFHPRPGPDLVVDPASVSFTPSVVAAQDTGFRINLRLLNLGTKDESVPDSMTLRFRQRLPSGEVRELTNMVVAVPHYDESLTLPLPNIGFDAVGLNRLLVTVDGENTIAELPAAGAEGNNELIVGGQPGVPLTVIANTARVAFPPDYAVVGPGVELVASSSDPLAPERKYRLQMALTSDFAQTLVDDEITAPGGVIRYRPTISFMDSTTYYWRISPDSSRTQDVGFIWSRSSFTYLRDHPEREVAFALQHPGQFVDGNAEDIIMRANDPKWTFGRNTNDIQIFNGLYQDRNMPRLVWNGTRFNSPHPWRIRAGIQVMVVDSTNNGIWYKAGDGSYNTPTGTATPWSFDTRTDRGREGLIDFLESGIAPGRYVFVYSVQRGSDIEYHHEGWAQDSLRLGKSIYDVLEAEGAEQARLLMQLGSVPYTFAYQKGRGPLGEVIATEQTATTELLFPIQENRERGIYATQPVGPALEWKNLRLRFSTQNIGTADSCYFQLYGEDPTGERTPLTGESLPITTTKVFDYDLSGYSAEEYPFMVAAVELFDEQDRTVASVAEIYFDYQQPGDVAISPSVAYSVPDSLEQGQVAQLEIGYENVSYSDLDSLLVELNVTDVNNRVTVLSKRQAPLAAGATDKVAFTLPTDAAESGLRLQLTLNPAEDQPEDVLFNNVLSTNLEVSADRIAPDLKVYYDGRRIRDGELVSGRPEILIQLRDESPYRRLNDSSAYVIQLISPDGATQTVALADERVEFIPAPPDGENKAEIYFRPDLQMDGKYSLVVQASDRSDNAAGQLEYRQSFEVINQQLISDVLTYPNPFTTQTRFVYTLTGNTPPDVFRIQIMTVAGRVVRDIDLLAYENITIGTHQTDFTWDGTDEYGDRLANGVYLYRVITSDAGGKTLESYDNGTSAYFRNGLGKVVILR